MEINISLLWKIQSRRKLTVQLGLARRLQVQHEEIDAVLRWLHHFRNYYNLGDELLLLTNEACRDL